MPTSKAFDLATLARTVSINALKDVDTATDTPGVGETLVWDGTNWVPGAGSGGGGTANFEEILIYTNP